MAHRLDMDNVTKADAAPAQEEVRLMCDEALLLVRDLIKETAVNLAACR